jgi:predicted DNA binding CopG/RHH family protein
MYTHRRSNGMPSTKNKIERGKKNVLDEDEFDPKSAKFRVTMFIDLPVLETIRKEAKQKGLPYQTYINQLLRDHVNGDEEKKIRAIVRDEVRKIGSK